MTSHQLLRIRIIVFAVAGLIFLVQALNPGILHSANGSRTLVIHLFLALFGGALLAQAYVLGTELRTRD